MGSSAGERQFLKKIKQIFFKILTLLGGQSWSSAQKNSREDCSTDSLQYTKIEIVMQEMSYVTKSAMPDNFDLLKTGTAKEARTLGAIYQQLSTDVDCGIPRKVKRFSKPKIVFNVGGVIFQTFEETVKHLPLLKNPETTAHYDAAKGEYFFDRDPEIFRFVLNYWRTGRLHLPLGRCGPSINGELALWGLEEVDIEPCCWSNYNVGLESTLSLEKLRDETRNNEDSFDFSDVPTHWLGRKRRLLWYLLTSPSYSKSAKVYEYIAIMFAIVAIFSFCASTSEVFHINNVPGSYTSLENSTQAEYLKQQPPSFATRRSAQSSHTYAARFKPPLPSFETRRSDRVSPILLTIDYICLAFFTLEYVLRFICAPKPLKFLVSRSSFIDVLAILPDYVEFVVQDIQDAANITELLLLLRLMRIVRIFRVIRRVPGLVIMMYTLKASYMDLSLMLLFLLVGTLLFGSVIYYVDDSKVFTSIPQSFWWAVVTMTTVGYGDMVPVTPLGQLVGSLTNICGVVLIGFTIPSLVNNFTTYYQLSQFAAKHRDLMEKKASQMTTRGSVDESSN